MVNTLTRKNIVGAYDCKKKIEFLARACEVGSSVASLKRVSQIEFPRSFVSIVLTEQTFVR